jgi:hypothetical protein
MPGLGSVAHRSFGDMCALIDSCRTDTPSGIVVASMVGPMKGFCWPYLFFLSFFIFYFLSCVPLSSFVYFFYSHDLFWECYFFFIVVICSTDQIFVICVVFFCRLNLCSLYSRDLLHVR